MNLPQREIKFRLIKDNKIVGYEWFNDGVWCYSEDGEMWNTAYIEHDEKNQYTGLKDKNGKEIYEGDIVSYGKEKYKVIWANGRAGFLCVNGIDTRELGIYSGNVIGNIFENPELLKREEEK